ncbi:MAG: hypothetical protein GYA39_04465 [Methanothrix sp.]|nr:hypothetical protein [Methanothrix sp.]
MQSVPRSSQRGSLQYRRCITSDFTQHGAPNVGHDVTVLGSITSEDAGFYFLIASAIIFMIAALTGHFA